MELDMESSIGKYIVRYSFREQLRIILLTVIFFPVLYLSLELPKIIINGAIDTSKIIELYGMHWLPIEYLLLLCGLLLITVFVGGLLKMRINTFKGIIGERMVRRLRYQLLERLLSSPPSQFKRVSQGEIIATVTSETEPLAGFIGDSLAQPLFQGGTMLTILVFMFMQNPVLGFVGISMIPLQVYIIPKMQKRLNRLKIERVQHVRLFATQIGESVDGSREILVYGTQNYHLAQFSKTLGLLFKIRLKIFKQKFLMKFINNLLNQLPPILFYVVGGVLIINGELTIGALVAILTAYKDLVPPWKELLEYYQQYQDVKVRYRKILENFNPSHSTRHVEFDLDEDSNIENIIKIDSLYLKNDYGVYIGKNINFNVAAGGFTSIYSKSSFLLHKLAQIMLQVEFPSSGNIYYGAESITQISKQRITGNISYVGPEPFLFNGTILQNINYSLRRVPLKENIFDLNKEQLEERYEAKASGNSLSSANGIWNNFSMAGVKDWYELNNWLQEVMTAIGTRRMVFEHGLKGYFDSQETHVIIAEKFINTRKNFSDQPQSLTLNKLVDGFSTHKYNGYLSVIENIAYGLVDKNQELSVISSLTKDKFFIANLQECNLYKPLQEIGKKISQYQIEKLGRIGPEGELFAHLKQYDQECTREQLGRCIDRPGHLPNCEFLLEMALNARISLLDECFISSKLQAKLVALRQSLDSDTKQMLSQYIEPLRRENMNSRLSVLENLVWGTEITPNDKYKHDKLVSIIDEILVKNNAESLVLITTGLTPVGIRGVHISASAKLNIQLIRALIKRPKILILHDALKHRTHKEQYDLIKDIRRLLPNMTIVMLRTTLDKPFEDEQALMINSRGAMVVSLS